MLHDRLKMAIGRIEIGLAKLERSSMSVASETDLSDLQAKHDRLKSEVQAAIADIDRLTGALEG